jgi:general transcription factor 3C polypeptide 3 (transcription factor C subunit 4)
MQNTAYISPFPPLQPQFPPSGYIPFSYPGTSYPNFTYLEQYDSAGPIVHDGFIPAPGHEDDDAGIYPTIPQELRNSMLQPRNDTHSSGEEDDSSDQDDDDEDVLRNIADANDKDEDSDFSISDADDADLDQDEELEEDELEEDLEVTDVQPRRRPGSAGGRPGAGGSRRGGPHVGSRGTWARGQKRFAAFDRRGKGGRHKGQRPVADPGPLFKSLQRSANAAYMGQKYDEAIEYANQAIQMNPEIFASHSLLSEIYLEMGREDKSIEALLVGAPTKRDKQLWFHILQRLWQLDEKEFPLYTRQAKIAIALDCLTSISHLDPNDFEARSQKLEIEIELGNLGRAVNLCIKMLQIRPDETEVLLEMAKLGFMNRKLIRNLLPRIIDSYDASIKHFLENDSPSSGNLDYTILNYYVELLERAQQYDKALTQIRVLSRWIEGRAAETYWDQYDDDREWDLEDHPRRTAVPEFGSSKHTGYGKKIPLELRMKMGIYRIRAQKSNFAEAMRHFLVLDPDDESAEARLFGYSDLFLEVAETLKFLGYYEEALRFYEPLLKRNPKVMTVASQLGLYTCYTELGRKDEADERILALKESQPRDLHEFARLAKFFEDLDMQDEALVWGDRTYHLGGARPLQDVGYKAVDVAQRRWWNNLRRYRAQEKIQRASKTNAERRASETEPVPEEDGPSKEEAEYLARSLKHARKSKFGKRGPYKPRKGTKRRERTARIKQKPQVESLQDAQDTTQDDTRLEVTDRRSMRSMLDMLARELPAQLEAARSLNRELKASFLLLRELSERADQGVPEAVHTWMELAGDLVKEFTGFKLFYYDRRQQPFVGYFKRIKGGGLWKKSALIGLAAYANKLEDELDNDSVDFDAVPEDFHGIPFENWLDILCQYAIYSARQGNGEQCFTTLNTVCKASPFAYQKSSLQRQYLCRLACGILLNDSKQVSDSIRWIMKRHPFASDIYRLYNHANSLCAISANFNTQVMQKTLLRFIKAMDHALLSPEHRKDFKFSMRERSTWQTKLFRNGGYEKYVKSHDPVMLTLFGHILCSGGTYPSALNYYFRAYAITPEDPVLNLCIASCYIQHCMKRLSENRQYQLQQGISFALRYYALRTKANIAVHCQEAEFNLGRLWHTVGLTHLAIPAYERCIALRKRVRDEQRADWVAEDFASEAAYAIQAILALAGDFKGARSVTEEILVIE